MIHIFVFRFYFRHWTSNLPNIGVGVISILFIVFFIWRAIANARTANWFLDENGWKWMKMDENGCKWKKIEENEWKWMIMDEVGWKKLKNMSEDFWRSLKLQTRYPWKKFKQESESNDKSMDSKNASFECFIIVWNALFFNRNIRWFK